MIVFGIQSVKADNELTNYINKYGCKIEPSYEKRILSEYKKVAPRIKLMLDGLKNKDLKKLNQGYGQIKWFRSLGNKNGAIGRLLKACKNITW